jgi:hypothetical protein
MGEGNVITSVPASLSDGDEGNPLSSTARPPQPANTDISMQSLANRIRPRNARRVPTASDRKDVKRCH